MEIRIDNKELQKISYNFRNIATRYLKSNSNNAIDNLKRFINYIENNELIWNFIYENNKLKIDIKNEIKNREFNEAYKIPINKEEEISYIYQLLKYASENCNDIIGICLYYPGSDSYYNNMISAFNNQVALPFVNYINTYLGEMLIDMQTNGEININVNGGQVNLAKDNGTVNANQSNNFNNTMDIDSVLKEFKNILKDINISQEDKEDTIEILDMAVETTKADKPKRSIIKTAIEKVKNIEELGSKSLALLGTANKIYEFFQPHIK